MVDILPGLQFFKYRRFARYSFSKSSRLPSVFVLCSPPGKLGKLAHIQSERMGDAGLVADAKHAQLVMVLARANDRAELFLSDLAAQCNVAKLNRVCAAKLMASYLSSERALGVSLNIKGEGNALSIDTAAVSPRRADRKFQLRKSRIPVFTAAKIVPRVEKPASAYSHPSCATARNILLGLTTPHPHPTWACRTVPAWDIFFPPHIPGAPDA